MLDSGLYISAHVLLSLSNELEKEVKYLILERILNELGNRVKMCGSAEQL